MSYKLRTLYHGTSMENYKSILEGKDIIKRNWKNSADDMIYFYSNDRDRNDVMMRAYGSALMCAAIQKSQHNKVAIIEMKLPEVICYRDPSDDFGNIDLERFCVSKEVFMADIQRNDFKVLYGLYERDKRWMYLYNLYHCTCGLDGPAADPYIVDKEEVYKACDEWYERQPRENYAYEHHFENDENGYKLRLYYN